MAEERQIAGGLDLGSSRTRLACVALEGGRWRLVGAASVEVHGWERDSLVDPASVARSVRRVVDELTRSTGVTVDRVVLGVGGTGVTFGHVVVSQRFPSPRVLGPQELHRLAEMAARLDVPAGWTTLHVFPSLFLLDEQQEYRNPTGVSCRRVDAEFARLLVKTATMEALVHVAHQAHLLVEEVVFEPVAAAYAAIWPEERLRGALLVDAGFASTELAAYAGEVFLGGGAVRISGQHFIQDVAQVFRLAYDDARLLVETYGSVLPSPEGAPQTELSLSRDGRTRSVYLSDLNEVLRARAEELFEMILGWLEQQGIAGMLADGVYLCGGLAHLDGLCDLAERFLGCPAQKALVQGLPGAEQLDPGWATAAGLAMYGARLRIRERGGRNPASSLRVATS